MLINVTYLKFYRNTEKEDIDGAQKAPAGFISPATLPVVPPAPGREPHLSPWSQCYPCRTDLQLPTAQLYPASGPTEPGPTCRLVFWHPVPMAPLSLSLTST